VVSGIEAPAAYFAGIVGPTCHGVCVEEKRCVTCKELRPLCDFNRRAASPDGLQPRCRECSREWYVENRVQHKSNIAVRRKRTIELYQRRIGAYLLEHPCVDCGEADLRVLDFDHRGDAHKRAAVGFLLSRLVAWHALEAEIEKCDVRCANCHRKRTAEMWGWWRHSQQLDRDPPAEPPAAS
jgi:hypothetical protein